MKKIILVSILMISIKGYSQISLDFQTPITHLQTVRLSNTVTKYTRNFNFIYNLTDFLLYNLDGTVYKTITLPPQPPSCNYVNYISYISQSLFDNDITNIEYLITYSMDSAGFPYYQVQIVREDGTILLNEQNAYVNYGPSNFDNSGIYQTEEGTKLRLDYTFACGIDYQTKIFNLPGEIPIDISENFNTSSISPLIYPNPNDGSFCIRFLGNIQDISTIDLLSSNGKLLNTYKPSNPTMHINNTKLIDGVYFLHIKTDRNRILKKVIIQN